MNDAKLAKAYEWLDKAVRFEAEKSGPNGTGGQKKAEMAFNQACKLEKEALAE